MRPEHSCSVVFGASRCFDHVLDDDIQLAVNQRDTCNKMNSIGENCNEMKRVYDACFNAWFAEKFLHGNMNDSACAPLFKTYQHCVKVSIEIDYSCLSKSNIIFFDFIYLQEAMKEQNIEFKEIEDELLGSDKEFKAPNGKSSGKS